MQAPEIYSPADWGSRVCRQAVVVLKNHQADPMMVIDQLRAYRTCAGVNVVTPDFCTLSPIATHDISKE